MSDVGGGSRFYGDLAEWWPLISAPEEYAEEAAFAATVLASASIPVGDVLELGSGGGNNATHLKGQFVMTLVDLSEAMLDVSRVLNPECRHRQGDMRTVRLGRTFDAVFVHDAVCSMTTEADVRAAMETAFVHCRPGGVAVFMPDDTTESFAEDTEHGGNDGAGGRGARYLAWSWDPDPADTWTVTEYAFVLRRGDGSVEVAHESHREGLFGREVWLRLLTEVGFVAESVAEVTSDDRRPTRGLRRSSPCSFRRALPAHHVVDLAALDVVDEAGDHLQRREEVGAGEQRDVFLEGGGVVVDREEAEVGPGQLAQLVVALAGQAALGVLHHHHVLDTEHVAGEGQAAQHVVGHPAPGVADDMRFTEMQAEHSEHVDAGVHARDHGQAASRAGVGDVGAAAA